MSNQRSNTIYTSSNRPLSMLSYLIKKYLALRKLKHVKSKPNKFRA